MCRLLPRSRGLPRFPGGSASASSLSRPSQASRALRPAGLLNRPRRPLSRGSSPVSCPTKPLVSYRSNRQLSGWNPPPLVIRAVGAHREIRGRCPSPGLTPQAAGNVIKGIKAAGTSPARPHHLARRQHRLGPHDVIEVLRCDVTGGEGLVPQGSALFMRHFGDGCSPDGVVV